ncbi:MAG: TonB-dependent receptor [Flavobacterium sp.]|uniref:SusC/RagA family TonB-linked outer membrane protein n=1 Tax=Flavobacterium sp. TaxID=239 RepID=UPI001222EA98|nr:TonB-dependent receptor [Flavobacterium sp.]RZJ65209.1 MAG: TonB-dependent receptor [Flavobacterium sp.]
MRNFIFCCFALLMLPAFAMAQTIKGKVLDEAGLPLPGVSIANIASGANTITDIDGNFSIAANAGDKLNFSFVGYLDQSVPAAAEMNVKMQVSSTELQEVVVSIGYGTASKRDLTGSIVKVSGKEVADKPNTNPVASLQGKVAGLTVVNSGAPGQQPDIRIRGTISRYKTQPLFVIDGIFNDNMDYVNPNDIESMEVLKDPSSLAIFGVRGANGVIIVTTKKGVMGKTIVNFATSTGVKTITDTPDVTNGPQFRALYDQQRINQGADPYPYYNLYNANTNWVDEIKESSPMITIYNLSISNANDKNRIYFGAGYTEEEGLIKYEKLKKFTFNVNDELKVSNRIKVGAGLNGYDARLPQLHNFISALNATPLVAPFNAEQGLYNQLPSELGGAQIGNPVADLEEKRDTQLNRTTRFVGNAFAEITILDGLKLRGTYLADFNFSKGRGYTPVFNVYSAESDEATPYGGNQITSVTQYKSDFQQLQQELLLTYDKTFGKHEFKTLFGYTRNELTYSSMNGRVNQYTNAGAVAIPNDPRFWYIDVSPYGDPLSRVSDSDEYVSGTVSYLARMLYNYDGKYLLNGSIRRDGSSELREWQTMWSVGGAWEISKEKFMSNQKAFDFLKIKGSIGELANAFTPIRYPTYPGFVPGAEAVLGTEPGPGQLAVPSFVDAFSENPNLRWEKVQSYEVGLELASFRNRFSFEANYYHKTTKDLLSFVTLGSESFFVNAGEIINKGWEFSASWKDKVGDFTYSLSGNITTIDNEVSSVFTDGFQIFDGQSITTAGLPIGSFYGYQVEGVYQSYADILASPPSSLGSYDVGDLKYKDRNGDGVVNQDDRGAIGNPTPDFTYGASLNIAWKGLSLGVDLQGVYGNEIQRDWGNGSTFAQFNYRTARLNAWNGAGTSNWEPRLNDASGYNSNNNFSTYMIEDGSYARLRNIQLGYDFKPDWISKAYFQSLRLYVNVQNAVTWSKNSGFTPEFGGSPTRFGVDTGGYPVPAVYSIGLNATF